MICTTSPCHGLESLDSVYRFLHACEIRLDFACSCCSQLIKLRFTSPPKHHRLFWFNDNQDSQSDWSLFQSGNRNIPGLHATRLEEGCGAIWQQDESIRLDIFLTQPFRLEAIDRNALSPLQCLISQTAVHETRDMFAAGMALPPGLC